MIPALFRHSILPMLEEVTKFSEARHAVLAGNVANQDTPGYQVRDLSPQVFQDRLKEALAQSRSAGRPVSLGFAPENPSDPIRQVSEGMESILYHDGSNDGLEQQVMALASNQQLHSLAITVMKSQFNLLQAAISERV